MTNKHTSMGKTASPNCASYVAGLVEGVLCAARMPCSVTAHLYAEGEDQDENPSSTIYVIKFAKEVTAREKNL